MALARARRNESGFNYWPGFVDALSTLVLSIVFLLSVFLVVQFFLSQEVTGKDKALEQLNAKIAQLNDLLSLEKLGKLNLDDQLSQMRAGLASAEAERDRVKGLYEGLAGAGNDAAGRANELTGLARRGPTRPRPWSTAVPTFWSRCSASPVAMPAPPSGRANCPSTSQWRSNSSPEVRSVHQRS